MRGQGCFMVMADVAAALAGGFSGFLQPGVALMLAPLLALLAAEACDAPPPWRPARTAQRAFAMAAAFALGFAPAVILVAASFAGSSPVAGWLEVLRQIGALALVLTGLSLLASFCRPGPAWTSLPRPGGLWGSWLVGLACGFNWLPAMGPALRGIVARMAEAGSGGMALLAAYALAMAAPFVLAAGMMAGLAVLLAARDARGAGPGLAASAILVLCGLLMLTGLWHTGVLHVLQWAPQLALRG